jgi:hypothetical protein
MEKVIPTSPMCCLIDLFRLDTSTSARANLNLFYTEARPDPVAPVQEGAALIDDKLWVMETFTAAVAGSGLFACGVVTDLQAVVEG